MCKLLIEPKERRDCASDSLQILAYTLACIALLRTLKPIREWSLTAKWNLWRALIK